MANAGLKLEPKAGHSQAKERGPRAFQLCLLASAWPTAREPATHTICSNAVSLSVHRPPETRTARTTKDRKLPPWAVMPTVAESSDHSESPELLFGAAFYVL